MTDTVVDVITKVKINTDLRRPPRYSVIIFNDDVTSIDFVVKTIMEVFGHSYDAAITIAQKVDAEGQGEVVSGLSRELASHLKDLVIMKARAVPFPLRAEIMEVSE